MDIRHTIIKMARAELSYRQLQQHLTPEQIERLYAKGDVDEKLPPKPLPIKSTIRSTLETVKPVFSKIPAIMNFLRTGYGNFSNIQYPTEMH